MKKTVGVEDGKRYGLGLGQCFFFVVYGFAIFKECERKEQKFGVVVLL